MSPGSLLVVGVGNPTRGDDGIGPAVIEAIRAASDLDDVETMVAAGDLSDLVVTWTPDQHVVIVDAMVGGGPPGTTVTIDGLRDPLPAADRPLSSHGFGLVDAVQLARMLGRLPRSLTIVAVQVGETDHLAPLTESAHNAVAEVVATVTAASRTGWTDPDYGRADADETEGQSHREDHVERPANRSVDHARPGTEQGPSARRFRGEGDSGPTPLPGSDHIAQVEGDKRDTDRVRRHGGGDQC
ncbi:MAG: hydrogenase maturation protease [Acidimicrobiia bacterium]|nr:hydrogenase maturation protease [Acidimicrobiia bacterium]